MYLLMSAIGIISALGLVVLINRGDRKTIFKLSLLSLLSFLGLFIGAKMLAIISFSFYLNSNNSFTLKKAIMDSGMVFYGGLFGFFSVFYLLAEKIDINHNKTLQTLSIICPAFHFWGRIGCFFAGCCYGVVVTKTGFYTPISITCNANESLPIQRVPVQLIESALIFVILLLLLIKLSDGTEGKELFQTYCFDYALIRFCLEFLRADSIRGFFWIFSFSQWISIAVIFVVFFSKLLERRFKNNEKKNQPYNNNNNDF